MFIESVELKDFRNYDYLSLDLDEGTNLLYGDNAQGKTNILEAISIASTTRSHRGAKDDELIRMSENDTDAHIKIIVNKEYTSDRIDIHLKKNKTKGIALNGIPIKRAADLFGILQIVFFSPEDLDIIRRGPGVRRHFLDMDISRVDPLYLNQLLDYNRVLESRNKLLKKISFEEKESDVKTLDVLDEQLVMLGRGIIEGRKKYLDKLNVLTEPIHKKLSGSTETIKLVYEPDTSCDTFLNDIKAGRAKDIKSGQTGRGPHRDDFTFIINSFDVKKFGSQGQKRTAALSLKLAQIDITKELSDEMPVLLLDDVLSELDSSRQEYLLDHIDGMQTIITCTGLDEWIKEHIHVNMVYRVSEGAVIPETQQ